MRKILEISNDKTRLQLDVIYGFLSTAYWATGRSREEITTSIAHTDCFGAYLDGQQVGFVRVLSDRVAFAYLMDVFIVPEAQGQGYAKVLLQAVFDQVDYQNVNKWLLITRDAHGLYDKLGFKALAFPERFMERGRI
jgi:GNAT superfamily N-acetyltransferase